MTEVIKTATVTIHAAFNGAMSEPWTTVTISSWDEATTRIATALRELADTIENDPEVLP